MDREEKERIAQEKFGKSYEVSGEEGGGDGNCITLCLVRCKREGAGPRRGSGMTEE